jgi:hypothetical protein
MKLNLDSLRSEIQDYIESHGMAAFYSATPSDEHPASVLWDKKRGDYKAFLAAAQASGARLVSIYLNEFDAALVDEAEERLEDTSVSRDERRRIESRLREMRAYGGFTCQIELSFDLSPRVYIFDLRTEWFEELNDVLYQIDDGYDEEEPGTDPLGGGYFSKN